MLAHNPNNALHLYIKGLALYRLKRLEEAERAIERSIPMNVSWLRPHLALAAIYYQRGEEQRAREAFRTAHTEVAEHISSQNAKQNHFWREEVEKTIRSYGWRKEESIHLDGEQLLLSAKPTEGRMGLITEGAVQYRYGLQWCAWRPGARLTCVATVPKPGRYRVAARFMKSNMSGRVQVAVGGQKLGQPFDGYASKNTPSGAVTFGEAEFSQGENEISFEVTGSHPRSDGHRVWIVRLMLTPLTEEAPPQDAR